MNATPTEAVRESVRSFITANFYVPDPALFADDTSMVESGLVDSTGVLEVLVYLEQAFAIQVMDAEVVPANFDSVQNIVAFIARKQQAGSAAA
jgi:acyl carrier protein